MENVATVIMAIYSNIYNSDQKTLTVKFIESQGDWDSGAGITVILSSEITNTSHKKMGQDYRFGFQTK
jgi:hypothetical protein